jgi:hypothetical protein
MKFKIQKHLIIIYITGILTLIIFFTFFYLILTIENKNTTTKEKRKSLQHSLDKINKYKPTPTSDNISLIEGDTKYIKQQLFNLETELGNPYIIPLKTFIKTLKKKENINNKPEKTEITLNTLKNFLEKWNVYYKKNTPATLDINLSEKTFKAYVKSLGYSSIEYYKAVNSFTDTLQKESYGKIDDVLAKDYLLNSVGFPLKITRIQCKELIYKIEQKINSELNKSKIISSSQTFNLFDEFTSIPNDDQIPHIVNYLWFYQNLIKTIIDSEITSLHSRKKLNGLEGENKNNITVLKYKIKIIGSLDSIRALINKLQSSYINNRMYSIDFVSFTKAADEAKKLPIPQKHKRKLDIELIIGASNLIKAEINLSYFIYNKPLITL